MSEQQLKDFAEAAERGVPVPDLGGPHQPGTGPAPAAEGRRGRWPRARGGRRRRALLGDPRRPQRPARASTRTRRRRGWRQELGARSLADTGPGRREGVRRAPLAAGEHGRHRGRFRVPGRHWVWREDGAVRPARPGSKVFPRRASPTRGWGSATPDRVPVHGLRTEIPTWTPLARTPIAAARQIARCPGVVLEQQARSTRVLGHPAAHVRMSVPRLCPGYDDIIVWGQASRPSASGTVDYPGQVLDVWVVDVDGLLVVVHTRGQPRDCRQRSSRRPGRPVRVDLTLDRVRR